MQDLYRLVKTDSFSKISHWGNFKEGRDAGGGANFATPPTPLSFL